MLDDNHGMRAELEGDDVDDNGLGNSGRGWIIAGRKLARVTGAQRRGRT